MNQPQTPAEIELARLKKAHCGRVKSRDARLKEGGYKRLNLWVPPELSAKIERVKAHYCCENWIETIQFLVDFHSDNT